MTSLPQAPVPVSVIVPTVGRRELLARCLRSVLACDPPPAEVVVVDQSGATAVVELLAELGSPAVVRVACDGRGTARAMNTGLAAATHDTVLVTHDDCTVAADWVGVGARFAAWYPGAIVTGRVLPPEGVGYVPSTKTDRRPHDFTGTRTSGVLYPANMVASRRALLDIGGFDERRTLLVAEDNDLCYRWLTEGRALRYEPDLVVWHHDWRTPEQLVRTHVAYARAQGGFYAKHLHAGDRRIVALLAWDLRKGARSLVRGLVRRRPRWEDPYREMTLSLLVGLVAGWREARALERDRRGRAPSR
ncbi:MAG TPA: glycosyltransferase [Acidimicrobiales bacterium]|nr:glycosyltransferase [Acidimicrobiales bacterium]